MGIMDLEKLKRDKMCIKCDGSWYTASGFEKFAGKGSNKKWKVSILHEGKPLQFWFKTGLLYKQGYTKKRKNPVKKSILESKTKLWKLEKGFEKPNRTYVPKKESEEESTDEFLTRVRDLISSRETSEEGTSDEEAENVSKSNGDERNCHDTRFMDSDDSETTDDEKTGKELDVIKPALKMRRICSESDKSEGSSASENVDPITSQYLSVIKDHICETPSEFRNQYLQ
ncbi:uncharacterized protein LOC107837840 [Poecilia formosa]|uniref:uncharacterized protein LOC107837840 n=1 Tax=Poecilia formosa TaxID=48698 RepID=UPI0007B7BCF3|nr:PREDICTED: uncharacterized protein LOC107837840 [Poecilia formosa]